MEAAKEEARVTGTEATWRPPRSREIGIVQRSEGVIISRHLRRLDTKEPEMFVLTQEYLGYPVGTVFIPNSLLEQEKRISHMAYREGLYSALRGLLYALSQLGLYAPEKGEIGQLQRNVDDVLTCSKMLKEGLVSETEVKERLLRMANGLSCATNRRKQKARKHIIRGSRVTDANGRSNPSAASMVRGAGVHALGGRITEIREIGRVLKRRARVLAEEIDRQMEPFAFLWAVLQPGVNAQKLGLLQGLSDASTVSETLPIQEMLMNQLYARFVGKECLVPFDVHCARAVALLAVARSQAENGNQRQFDMAREQLRGDMEWVRVRHEINLGPVAKLGLVLEELERAKRIACLEATGLSLDPQDITFYIGDDPQGFATVIHLTGEMKAWVTQLPDVTASKARALDRLQQAELAMRNDYWALAKRSLKECAAA